jgi:hemolysin-activating ACP:hemolysin acyltransferase
MVFVFSVAKDFPHDENHHDMLGMIQTIFLHSDFFRNHFWVIMQQYITMVLKKE